MPTTLQNRNFIVSVLKLAVDQYHVDAQRAYSNISDPQQMNKAARQFIEQRQAAEVMITLFESGMDLAGLFDDNAMPVEDAAWFALKDIVAYIDDRGLGMTRAETHEALRKHGLGPEHFTRLGEDDEAMNERDKAAPHDMDDHPWNSLSPGGETVEELAEAAVRANTEEFPTFRPVHDLQVETYLSLKESGVDLTEDQSAHIKRVLDNATDEQRALLAVAWPLEYDEWCEQKRPNTEFPVIDFSTSALERVRARQAEYAKERAKRVGSEHLTGRDLSVAFTTYTGLNGWLAWMPPRGPQDYEGGNVENGAVLDGFGDTYWENAQDAGRHLDHMAEKVQDEARRAAVETVVVLKGQVYARYKNGEITDITYTPPNVSDAAEAVDYVEDNDDLDISDQGVFWQAIRAYLAEYNHEEPSIRWTE